MGPLDTLVSESGDSGTPFVTRAEAVEREVAAIHEGSGRPVVAYDSARGHVRVELPSGEAFAIDPVVLRQRDKGAGASRPPAPGAYPEELREMGNYSVAVRWSD